jgi:CheY-like chemotaxis protein/nitrogen-specific signal transduction histidine kinase
VDITVQVESRAEVEKLNVELQAAARAKDEFLALLGHELRNPLAAIAGATELLVARDRARNSKGNSNAALPDRFLSIIQRQNRHLSRILDDLLDVSRMMSGRLVLDTRPLNLAESVRQCVEALRATEAAQGHVLRVEADEAWVQADPMRVEQIIDNLVANALKFSPVGGEVMVRVDVLPGTALLHVSDSGDGIPPELLRQVFEPFVQGPAPTHGAAGGLGIGLALVRQLVDLHHGEVRASSKGPGLGASFEVRLPLIEAQAPALPDTLAASYEKRRVLLVEDNPDARETTAELLRVAGYEVAEAADGEAALRAVQDRTPDVVVMDIGLPGMSGHEVAREFRQMPLLRSAKLIALSGYGQARDKAESAAAGFDTHLVKPVDPDALVGAIEQSVSGHPA